MSLSASERRCVAEVSIQAQTKPVIVQVTAFSTFEAHDLALHAEQAGAAAVAVGRPYYWRMTEAATIDYFAAITTAVRCPVFLVSRGEADTTISPALLLHLAALHPNIAGVIELGASCIAPVEIRRLAISQDRPFITALNAPAAASAAYGLPCAFVSHLGTVAPDLVRMAVDSARTSNVAGTRDALARLLGLERVLGRDPGRIKHAMAKVGQPSGNPRAPLSSPGPEIQRAIDTELQRQGLLTDLNVGWTSKRG
ncbi:MAG: dihydrodipicolinate synthase family protein [Burkholderiales bacterium]